MPRLAKLLTATSFALMPVVVYFSWPRVSMMAACALVSLPFGLALAAFAFPGNRALRWAGFVLNGLYAALMLYGFSYMLVHVPAPPGLLETLPVLAVAAVLLLTPMANCWALSPRPTGPRR